RTVRPSTQTAAPTRRARRHRSSHEDSPSRARWSCWGPNDPTRAVRPASLTTLETMSLTDRFVNASVVAPEWRRYRTSRARTVATAPSSSSSCSRAVTSPSKISTGAPWPLCCTETRRALPIFTPMSVTMSRRSSLNRSTAMLGTWTESSTYAETRRAATSSRSVVPSIATITWLLCSSPNGTGHLLPRPDGCDLLDGGQQDRAAEPDTERVVDAVDVGQRPPQVRTPVLAVGEGGQRVPLGHDVHPARDEP